MSSKHTQAADLAANDVRKVLASFTDEPFMSKEVSPSTANRQQAISSAAPDIQNLLLKGLPQSLVERLARLDSQE